MMRRRVVFREIVGVIVFPLLPMNSKLSLLHSILYPEEPHVHSLGPLDFGPSVGKSVCCGVVGGYSCWFQLLSSNFLQYVPHVRGFLAVVEQCPNFCFRRRRHHILHDATLDVDWAIWFGNVGRLIVVTQIEVSANP